MIVDIFMVTLRPTMPFNPIDVTSMKYLLLDVRFDNKWVSSLKGNVCNALDILINDIIKYAPIPKGETFKANKIAI